MTEVLSAEEIDQLLRAINAGDDEPEDFRPARNARKIKIYDFKRPDKFSKENVRTVSIVHESFARLISNLFTCQLGEMVHVHVASVDQLTYEEFIRCIPTPTCMAVINMDPLKGNAVIEIDPAITFSIIHLLLDGNVNLLPVKSQHELTDLEQCLMEPMIIRMLGCLRESWNSVLDLRPRLAQIDTTPQFVQIAPYNEMVVLVTFEVRIGDVEGIMNFCIPYMTIEPIIGKLSASFWYSTIRRNATTENLADLMSRLKEVEVDTRAIIFRQNKSIKEITKLKVGDVIHYTNKHPTRTENMKDLLMIDNFVIGEYEPLVPKSGGRVVAKLKKVIAKNEENYMDKKPNVEMSLASILDVKLPLIVELGRTKKMIKEILGMGEGTIIELDKEAGAPVDIFAANALIARGEVVVIDENFGVRVTEIVNRLELNDEDYKEVFGEDPRQGTLF